MRLGKAILKLGLFAGAAIVTHVLLSAKDKKYEGEGGYNVMDNHTDFGNEVDSDLDLDEMDIYDNYFDADAEFDSFDDSEETDAFEFEDEAKKLESLNFCEMINCPFILECDNNESNCRSRKK